MVRSRKPQHHEKRYDRPDVGDLLHSPTGRAVVGGLAAALLSLAGIGGYTAVQTENLSEDCGVSPLDRSVAQDQQPQRGTDEKPAQDDPTQPSG
jgi:hypothetical protein